MFHKCRRLVRCSAVVARFTAFRYTLTPLTGEPETVLRRHAGAARFAYNQLLGTVKRQLDARSQDRSVSVAWTGFDLINTFNAWKHTADAGRLMVVDATGVTTVVTTGLRWRAEVCQQVFEEAAVDLGRGLAAFTATRRAAKARRVGFPGSNASNPESARSGFATRPPPARRRSSSAAAAGRGR